MSEPQHPIFVLLQRDPRFKLDAYQFVREALSYAQDEMGLGLHSRTRESGQARSENHLTGQELCEAIRLYAIEQYGYMAKAVLNSWGVYSTSDFGDIVYNLIDIELMKKSENDRREHFDDVYDFDEAFVEGFRITMME
jgi:uncharacterized repeat protein (TIGR04138 family)